MIRRYMVGVFAALGACGAWAEEAKSTYSEADGKEYNWIFKGSADTGSGASWNTLTNWYSYAKDSEGVETWTVADGTSLPGLSGNRWRYLLFDGDLLDASITAAPDGYKAVTSSGIEGWNMGFGFYNHVKVTVSSCVKNQPASGSVTSWVIDATSKFIINGWGNNGNYGPAEITIANVDGLEMAARNNTSDTWNFSLSSNGCFKITTAATSGNYRIRAAELLASDLHNTGEGRAIYSKKIGTITTGTTVTFGFADNPSVTAPDGYTAVPQTTALTVASAIGACAIRQTDTEVYLDYVDRSETGASEFTINSDTTWSALVGGATIGDAVLVTVAADATLTFDVDPGNKNIYLSGDKNLTPVTGTDVTVTASLNCDAYTGTLKYSAIPSYPVSAVNLEFDARAGLAITNTTWLTRIRTENKVFTFVGSGENGVTLDYGTTHYTAGGAAFSSHIVLKGGKHTMQYRRESANAKFGANATQDNPTIRVTDGATLTFAARNLCGWTSGASTTDGIIRVDNGSTLNFNPTNGTAYWAQQFYLEPGSTMNIGDTNDNFRPNGGTAQATAQIYVPACEADAANKIATINCASGSMFLKYENGAVLGCGVDVGANATLRLNTAITGGQYLQLYGAGAVEFAKPCAAPLVVKGTNRITVPENITLTMLQIDGSCSVTGAGKVISSVNPANLTAADTWTGTVEISALDTGAASTSLDLAKIGNANSKIIIKGITSSNLWPKTDDKVEAEVQLDGPLTFSNGSSNKAYHFRKFSGSGNLTFNWTDGTGVSYTIDELNAYTGILSTTNKSVTLGNIVKTDAAYGTPLVKTSITSPGTIVITATKVNGATVPIFQATDGIYYVAAVYNGTNYTTVAAAVEAAAGADLVGNLTVYDAGYDKSLTSGYAAVTALDGGAITFRKSGTIYWVDGDEWGYKANALKDYVPTFSTSMDETETTEYIEGDTICIKNRNTQEGNDQNIWLGAPSYGKPYVIDNSRIRVESHGTNYIWNGSTVVLTNGAIVYYKNIWNGDDFKDVTITVGEGCSFEPLDVSDGKTILPEFEGAVVFDGPGTIDLSKGIKLRDGATLTVPASATRTVGDLLSAVAGRCVKATTLESGAVQYSLAPEFEYNGVAYDTMEEATAANAANGNPNVVIRLYSGKSIPDETGLYRLGYAGDGFNAGDVISVIQAKDTSSAKAAVAVAVPFLGLNGEAVTVDNLLKPEYLAAGDQLLVYNAAGKKYRGFALAEDKKAWSPITVVSGGYESQSDDKSLTRGDAVWVTTAGKVVVYGKPAEMPTLPEAAGSYLLGNSTMNDYAPDATAFSDGVIIEVPDDAAEREAYKVVDGAWKKRVITSETIQGVPVPVKTESYTADGAPTIPVGRGYILRK